MPTPPRPGPLDADARRLAALLPLARKLAEICAGTLALSTEDAVAAIQEHASRMHEATEHLERDAGRHESSACDPEVCDWCADEARAFGGREYEPTLSAEQLNAGAVL